MLKKLLPECFISLNDKNNLATIVHYATIIYLFILTFIFIDYKTNTNLFFFLLIIVSLTIAD